MVVVDAGVEDEEKWLAEGIAGLQHNAFYMHRALVSILNPNPKPNPYFVPNLETLTHFIVLRRRIQTI